MAMDRDSGELRVGNDVVYRRDPHIAAHHLKRRFVDRVCSPGEAGRVRASREPGLLLWSLWAAKEAAYKAVVKLRPGTPFAHRRFVVAESLAAVRYEDLQLSLELEANEEWVHAVARTGETAVLSSVERKEDGADQKEAVRALAIEALAARFDLPRDCLEIVRRSNAGGRPGPPELLMEGQPTGVDISLSHDGPFVAFAAIFSGQPLRAQS